MTDTATIDRILAGGRDEIAAEQDPVIKRLLMECLAEWQAEKKRRQPAREQ